MSYTIRILPRAENQLASINSPYYDALKKKIYSLANNPRPPGCRKLADYEGWRVRVGDYRVVYEIDDAMKTVTVLRAGHRKDVYR